MKTRKLLLGLSATIFVAYECFLYYLIHFKKADPNYILAYRTIIVATIFAFATLLIKCLTARSCGEKISRILFNLRDGNLIRIAMVFTLIADYFLVVVTEDKSLTGVSVFLGTQLFIFLHILMNDSERASRRRHIITRLIAIPLMIALSYLILDGEPDTLAIVSMIYYANLLTSILFAHRIGRGGIILTVASSRAARAVHILKVEPGE